MRRVCLFLDEESIIILDQLKFELNESKSRIGREIIHYFNEEINKKKLKKIMKEKDEKNRN